MSFAALRDGVLATRGENVTVTVGVVQTALTAVFLSPWSPRSIAGVAAGRPDPQLLARQSEWEATGAKAGSTVTRNAIPYTVVAVQPDDAGFVHVTLKRYL